MTPQPPLPRLPPLDRADAGDRARRLLDSFPTLPGLDGRGPDRLLATLARHPAIVEPWNEFAGALLRVGSLTPCQRELVILRVAWRRRNAYVWGGHAELARGTGMTADEIRDVASFPGPGSWAPLDRALLTAADEMLDLGRVTDPTSAALAPELSEQALIELPIVVG